MKEIECQTNRGLLCMSRLCPFTSPNVVRTIHRHSNCVAHYSSKRTYPPWVECCQTACRGVRLRNVHVRSRKPKTGCFVQVGQLSTCLKCLSSHFVPAAASSRLLCLCSFWNPESISQLHYKNRQLVYLPRSCSYLSKQSQNRLL